MDALSEATVLPELGGKKVLLVSSAGGHLAELLALSNAAGVGSDSLWVVPDTPQSRSLLRRRRTMFVPYVGPRALRAALRAACNVAAVLRYERFDYCVSTGAAIAAFTLPLAAIRGIRAIYVESLARSNGPSLTGRMLRLAPRVRTMTQSPFWQSRSWPYAGTVIDDYSTAHTARDARPLRIFVTLGTIRPYRFDRAIDAIKVVLEPDDQVEWQLGVTMRNDLPGDVHREMGSDEIRERMASADVVIAHAGVGSALDALAVGRTPVLIVRRRAHGEHVDDHQLQLADMIRHKKLALELDLSAPLREPLERAAASTVRRIRETGRTVRDTSPPA